MDAARNVLAQWGIHEVVRPAPDAGLINQTYVVGEPPRWVLQRVSPIFDPRIHDDIAAVTERLRDAMLLTPSLVPTSNGRLWVGGPDGEADVGHTSGSPVWRLLTYVPGRTLHTFTTPAQAASAGALIGSFHAILATQEINFQAPPRHIHDTPARMSDLDEALATAPSHPLAAQTAELSEGVLADWHRWLDAHGKDLDLPERPCHGDLKASNLRFDAAGNEAICLLDLDTLGPMSLASEMGDAWRSWCNPAGEDDPAQVRFDLDIFRASARAWLEVAPPLELRERHALVPAIERICLELAARFAADAVRNTYFREDRARFPEPGQHNLVRARAQLRLAGLARDAHEACEAALPPAHTAT